MRSLKQHSSLHCFCQTFINRLSIVVCNAICSYSFLSFAPPISSQNTAMQRNIQDVSWVVYITVRHDLVIFCDQRSSYQHGAFYQWWLCLRVFFDSRKSTPANCAYNLQEYCHPIRHATFNGWRVTQLQECCYPIRYASLNGWWVTQTNSSLITSRARALFTTERQGSLQQRLRRPKTCFKHGSV